MQHQWSNLFKPGKLYRVVVNSSNGTKLLVARLITYPKWNYFKDVVGDGRPGVYEIFEPGDIFMCVGIVRFKDYEFLPEPPLYPVALYGEKLWVFDASLERLWYQYKFEEVG